MNRQLKIILLSAIIAMSPTPDTRAQVGQGSGYQLEQSVIASGGGTSADPTGNVFSVTGSIGQSIADSSAASPFAVKSGFFTAPPTLAPTVAAVTISGRAMTVDGRGIRNVLIILSDSSGKSRQTVSASFGYYRFDGVTAGDTYILTTRSKRFSFASPSQVFSFTENAADVNFIGSLRASNIEL